MNHKKIRHISCHADNQKTQAVDSMQFGMLSQSHIRTDHLRGCRPCTHGFLHAPRSLFQPIFNQRSALFFWATPICHLPYFPSKGLQLLNRFIMTSAVLTNIKCCQMKAKYFHETNHRIHFCSSKPTGSYRNQGATDYAQIQNKILRLEVAVFFFSQSG